MPTKAHGGLDSFLTPAGKDRFWSLIQKGKDSECWIWMGSKTTRGRAIFQTTSGSISVGARRLAYALGGGKDPGHAPLYHRPRGAKSLDLVCCNPGHLFAGNEIPRMPTTRSFTTKPKRILTDDQVDEILQRWQPRPSIQQLASEYGVCATTIFKVLSKKRSPYFTHQPGDS